MLELNKIHCGDCRQLSRLLPDKIATLGFCDPPYWVDFTYGSGQNDNQMDYIEPIWIVNELKRIAQVVLVIPGIVNMYNYPKPNWVYGWFKPGSTRRSMILNGFNTWEPVLVYGQPAKRVYQDSSYLPSVSNLNDKSANFHGCPKPVGLMLDLVEKFTNPGDLVVDLMIGSGTTGIACKKLGRNFVGFEIDPHVVSKASERIQLTQPPLFVHKITQLEF